MTSIDRDCRDSVCEFGTVDMQNVSVNTRVLRELPQSGLIFDLTLIHCTSLGVLNDTLRAVGSPDLKVDLPKGLQSHTPAKIVYSRFPWLETSSE